MTIPRDQSRKAHELQQQGLSLQQIAAELDTSDDRVSQLIAAYQKQQPAEPQQPWWHGLSPHTRVFLQEQGMHSRADVEQGYRDGLFTRGHPNAFRSITAHLRRRIVEWLNQPVQPYRVSQAEYPMDETITLRLQADTVRELERIAKKAGTKPDALVEALIMREAECK
ncbi:hypothetical protein [Halomonas garicola]|uniref:hypothetical protein n=1 Tax=Halomonas garicola TaxID=1690008 RepID=UPI0028A1B66C|nr:hypothetical protein [Halomonas garicola]